MVLRIIAASADVAFGRSFADNAAYLAWTRDTRHQTRLYRRVTRDSVLDLLGITPRLRVLRFYRGAIISCLGGIARGIRRRALLSGDALQT